MINYLVDFTCSSLVCSLSTIPAFFQQHYSSLLFQLIKHTTYPDPDFLIRYWFVDYYQDLNTGKYTSISCFQSTACSNQFVKPKKQILKLVTLLKSFHSSFSELGYQLALKNSESLCSDFIKCFNFCTISGY